MLQRFYIVCIVGVLFLQVVIPESYDCRRDNPTCTGNGKCGPESGRCVCSAATFIDYACALDTTTIPVPCNKVCTNGGTCYGNPEACFCPPEFYGDLCENRRAFVACEGDKMKVTLRPYTEPNQVFVTKFKEDTSCIATKDPTSGEYSLTINFAGGVCDAGVGDTVLTDYPDIGDTTYRNFVVVQYSAQFETALDDIYTVSCLISANNTMPVSGSVSTITVDQRNDLMKGEAKGTYQGLLFELLDEVGALLTTAQLGVLIRLRISLKDTNVFKAIKVQSCEARDKAVDETSTLLLASDGCASLEIPASYVIRSGFMGDVLPPDNLPYVEMTLTAFKFTTGPEVHFRCSVLLCRDGDTSCDPTKVCPFGESKGKRKKRARQNEAEISGSLTIIDPYDRTGTQLGTQHSSTEQPDSQEECSMSREILIILITLGITVLILALACVFLAMRYIRIRSVTTKPEEPRVPVPVMNMSKSYRY